MIVILVVMMMMVILIKRDVKMPIMMLRTVSIHVGDDLNDEINNCNCIIIYRYDNDNCDHKNKN